MDCLLVEQRHKHILQRDYSVVGTSATCGSTPQSTTVTINPKPDAGADQTICAGNTVTLTGSPTAGTSWTMYSFNPTGVTLSNTVNGIATASFPNTASGTYNFVFSAGCTDTMSVVVNPLPSVGVISSSNNLGNALNLDGINDYIITPNLYSSFATSDLTIELWFKANAAGVIAAELGTTTLNSGWYDSQIEILSTGEVLVRVWNLSSVSLGTVAFGSWNHVVIRYASNTSKLDGLLNGVASSNSVTGVRSTSTSYGFGYYYSFGATTATNLGSGAYFNGIIDEIRIWNVVRTNIQIQANMNTELIGNEAGLVLYYNLNQGTANATNTSITSITDKTANAYNGTINNIALSGTTSNFVTGANNNLTYVGGLITLSSSTTGGVWSSGTSGIATINSSGVISGVAVGNSTITYSVTTVSGCSSSVTSIVTVNPKPNG